MKPFFFFFLLSSFFCFSSLPVFALLPNDIRLSEQWYLEKIHAYDAWDITTGSSEVIVAVLDTGLDLHPPDLQQNLWINEEEFPDDGIDNDHNGYIDDRYGWDFITLDGYPDALQSDTYDASSVSHGTLVAGLIAAVGKNLESTTGIAWNAKIMPIRVLDELGSGTSLYAADAIYYAVNNGARIINLSFTGLEIDNRFLEAIHYAYKQDVLVVAAVGHDSLNVNEAPLYPACFSGEEDWVLGVAATDREDKKADFSNYGSSCVDISAPGVEVYGLLYHDESSQDFLFTDGGYWEGTSTSTPIVSGAVALLLGRFPTLTPSELKLVLQLAADPLAEKGTDP